MKSIESVSELVAPLMGGVIVAGLLRYLLGEVLGSQILLNSVAIVIGVISGFGIRKVLLAKRKIHK